MDNSKKYADYVLKNLITVTEPCVKGAHDAHMAIVDDKAYIVYEANDVQVDEDPRWPFIYCAMSIVDIKENRLLKVIKFAESEKEYNNEKLPFGCCFVPRVLKKDAETLRVYFASENPGVRQEIMYYIDFDIKKECFDNNVYKLKLVTEIGVFDFQPKPFYEQAKAIGFDRAEADEGFFLLELGKKIGDSDKYVILNNFVTKQNAIGIFNDELDAVTVLGNYNNPTEYKLSESAVNVLPDGRWFAIIRSDMGDYTYKFAESFDGGKTWTDAKPMDFIKGSSSKPIFDKFNEVYYLGWTENFTRTKFNIDVSKDGMEWKRAYTFDLDDTTFQYPELMQYNGDIYIAVTQGKGKERIMFGLLEKGSKEYSL